MNERMILKSEAPRGYNIVLRTRQHKCIKLFTP